MLALEISIGVAHGASAFDQMLSSSFKANGIAGLDRLNQDAAQKFCSNPVNLSGGGDPKIREKIQNANMTLMTETIE